MRIKTHKRMLQNIIIHVKIIVKAIAIKVWLISLLEGRWCDDEHIRGLNIVDFE